MKEYVLSWWSKELAQVLVRRPWWNLLGKDQIVTWPIWQRKSIKGLSKEEADMFISASPASAHGDFTDPRFRFLSRVMGGDPRMVQLEEFTVTVQADQNPSEYVSVGVNPDH